jgi:SAM-dependent methyltransferase
MGETLVLEHIACPLCGCAASVHVLTGRDNLCGVPGEFHVVRCTGCGHLYMNPRPVAASLAACYPAQYGPHQADPETAASVQSAAAASLRPWYLRWLPLRYIPGLKWIYTWLLDDRSQPVPGVAEHRHVRGTAPETPLRALELGCATGRYLQRLEQAGWRVRGVELSESASSRAMAVGLDVHCGVLETLPGEAAEFDLAAAWMVLEHIPDVRGTLRELHRRLRPGGRLLFSIPNAGCWEPLVFGTAWYVWELPRHLHHFTPKSIRKLLTECGYGNIEVLHQRTILNIVGSAGITILNRHGSSRLGSYLKRYPDQPTLAGQLLLAPFAHLLALLGQGGRLTISATRGAESGQ